jgi:hypothetical protein
MPTSDASQISTIVEAIVELRPRRVLDVGPGYGKYGMLIREYLGPILQRVDAAEPWPQGMMPALRQMYNEIVPAPFPGRIAWMRYDLVLMVDVLEHYEQAAGRDALAFALDLAPHVLIATPHQPLPQGRVNGNPWEEHKSSWTAADLSQAGGRVRIYPHPHQLIALLGRSTTP